MLLQNQHIFHFFRYNHALGALGKLINIVSTFVWTYMDVFVIIISVGLVFRLRQINERLLAIKGHLVEERFWVEHRLYYRSIGDLCDTIDREIGMITLVSFSNNLFFICVQLLMSMK